MHLSIVMPVYNCERFVAEAIASVIAQTHRDWSLLIWNDGSTDGTADACRKTAGEDRRIRIVSHPNAGIAHAMNGVLNHVATDWVAVMHGDDVMLPHRLEKQLAFIALNPGVAVVSSLVDWIDDDGRHLGRSRSALTTPRAVADARHGDGTIAFPHPAVMFRKSVVQAVGGYRQDFWPAEDTELWNRIADARHDVLVQDEVLMQYRIHAASASMSRTDLMTRKLRWMGACVHARRAGSAEPTWDQYLADEHNRPWPHRLNEWRKHWADVCWYQAMSHLSGKRLGHLIPSLAMALSLRPATYLRRVLPRITGKAA